jgi:NAD(P)H-dependent FMN reductase
VNAFDGKVTIGVVLGSCRQPRLGDRVCKFVLTKAREVPDVRFTVLDLASYGLPFFDEEIAPLNNPNRTPTAPVRRWLDDMAAADGYLFVTPEYNYAVPAVMKNALDFLAREADGKPASILSYSDTMHGGNIAGHELRLTVNKLGMFPMPKSLPLANAHQMLAADGTLVEESPFAAKVAAFIPWSLTELARYAALLRQARVPAAAGSLPRYRAVLFRDMCRRVIVPAGPVRRSTRSQTSLTSHRP